MGTAVLILRLGLALVFAVAGLAKLADPGAMRETLLEFGVPPRMAVAGAIALPLAELAVAALLLPTVTARWGAAGALVLLAAFCVAIGRALARGERPDCGCLGSVHSSPIGPNTLVRNAILCALAVMVLAAGAGRSLAGVFGGVHLTPLAIVATMTGVVVAVQAWFVWQLFLQNGRLLARVRALEEPGAPRGQAEGLPVGAPAPALEFPDHRTLTELLIRGRPVALVFSTLGCDACTELLPELHRLRDKRDGELDIALIENNREAFADYRISAVPSATLVNPDGRVATSTVTGADAVKDLLETPRRPATGLLRVMAG